MTRLNPLGTAVLGKPIKATEMVKGTVLQDSDRIDHSLFGWPLTEVQRFDAPIPMNGAQGFWNFDHHPEAWKHGNPNG